MGLPAAEQYGLVDFSFRLHKALEKEGEEEARMRKAPRQVPAHCTARCRLHRVLAPGCSGLLGAAVVSVRMKRCSRATASCVAASAPAKSRRRRGNRKAARERAKRMQGMGLDPRTKERVGVSRDWTQPPKSRRDDRCGCGAGGGVQQLFALVCRGLGMWRNARMGLQCSE